MNDIFNKDELIELYNFYKQSLEQKKTEFEIQQIVIKHPIFQKYLNIFNKYKQNFTEIKYLYVFVCNKTDLSLNNFTRIMYLYDTGNLDEFGFTPPGKEDYNFKIETVKFNDYNFFINKTYYFSEYGQLIAVYYEIFEYNNVKFFVGIDMNLNFIFSNFIIVSIIFILIIMLFIKFFI